MSCFWTTVRETSFSRHHGCTIKGPWNLRQYGTKRLNATVGINGLMRLEIGPQLAADVIFFQSGLPWIAVLFRDTGRNFLHQGKHTFKMVMEILVNWFISTDIDKNRHLFWFKYRVEMCQFTWLAMTSLMT